MQKLYRLYVDESGNHYYSDSEDPEQRYLCLNGVIFEAEYYESVFRPEFEGFKLKHFSQDVDDRIIIFHRKELINKEAHFSILKDPEKEKTFNEELLNIMSNAKFGIITVVIDKKSHRERWGKNAAHPYNYCLLAIVQRYVGFLNFYNCHGDVLAESRGGKEDLQLKSEFQNIYTNGSTYVSASSFQKALTSKEIKLKKKFHNIAGLQVADIFAHPCKQSVLLENKCINKYCGHFGKKLCEIADKKYNRRAVINQVNGYGKVFIK